MTDRAARQARIARIAAVALVVTALAIAHRSGVFERFADPSSVRQTLVGLGGWGHLAFVATYTVLQPFGVPGTVFILAAPLIWPWPVAFALSIAGTMAASVLGFSFARFVARDWVKDRVPARIRRYEAALERRAFSTVFWMRLVFWMPQWLHAFFGVSNVSFATHFWGSLGGYALPLFLVSFFGEELFAALSQAPKELWVALGVATVLVAFGAWLAVRSRARRDLRDQ